MVLLSGRGVHVCGGAVVDVVYATLDRGYCVCGAKCKEYLEDDKGGEGTVGGVEGGTGGVMGEGCGGCNEEIGVAEECGGVGC